MLSHKKIWAAIDRLAKESGLTASGLAKKAGLDPTSFNKSKRIGSGGKLRWPSTESLYKILKVLNKDLSYFSSLVEPDSFSEVSIIGTFQNDLKGFAEAEESELEKLPFPRDLARQSVAIKIKGYSMEPAYKNGDVLVVSKKDDIISEEDRIVIKTLSNEILIKELVKKEEKYVTAKSIGEENSSLKISVDEIDWIGRIIWVRQ